jgi:hypothetical protein
LREGLHFITEFESGGMAAVKRGGYIGVAWEVRGSCRNSLMKALGESSEYPRRNPGVSSDNAWSSLFLGLKSWCEATKAAPGGPGNGVCRCLVLNVSYYCSAKNQGIATNIFYIPALLPGSNDLFRVKDAVLPPGPPPAL